LPEGAAAELVPAELAADVVEAAALLALLLLELLLPQADSAIALIKHAATTTRTDLGRRMRAQMLSCGGIVAKHLLRVSARVRTARL
jgi:hypothetical protein